MKMWSMKVIILLLFCYACLSTGGGKVYFVSRNFFNILHWDPVQPDLPGEKVLYSVSYWSDTMETPSYQKKKECQNITALSCNLTAETPSLYDVYYRAQLYANSRVYNHTITFKPLAHTTFGPPILSTYTTASSLHVNVSLPLGPNGVSVGDIITSSKKGPNKAETVYILKITHPTWAALANETKTGQFVINLKKAQTEYCGYVFYKPNSELGRPVSERASFCVTLPGDPLKLLPWLLGVAALVTAIIITSAVFMCNYVKGGKDKSMPQLLVTTFNTTSRVLNPDRNIIISKPEICVQSEHTVYATIRTKPNMPSVGTGGYSPQDILCTSQQGSTGSSVGTGAHTPTPNHGDMSAQSSEIYSVVAVHVPSEHNEDFQQAPNDRETSNLPFPSSGNSCDIGRMSPKLTSQGEPPLPDLDPCENNLSRPLLLQAVRDINGQLTLPSLALQLKSSTGDTVSPFNSERKPLLSDLIDSRDGPSLSSLQSFEGSELSDSGCDDSTVNTPTQPYCNTNYCPSQPVAPYFQQGCQVTPSSDSGYKQNWIPATLLESTSKDCCEHRRTNHPWTWTAPKTQDEGEEDEDRGGEERSRQFLLGGWGLQIQE
ncbi:interferon lambda receptor 1 [Plectropomus leopardus]|uniref:interferon lambda receptor 1 n=1 Tax=Plectropomus leopardus TaxID=160734 RepID=UPI001C4BD4A8|nr:interferon lambda receptor 1 [Plectropomus leopardus]